MIREKKKEKKLKSNGLKVQPSRRGVVKEGKAGKIRRGKSPLMVNFNGHKRTTHIKHGQGGESLRRISSQRQRKIG